MKQTFARLLLLTASLGLVSSLPAQIYVGNLNGTHISSTFTTNTDGTNALSGFGWTSYTGAPARVFGQSGGTTNDVLIADDGNPFSNYGVQFNTGVTLVANATYTYSLLVGYVSGGTIGSNTFSMQIGTWNGATFTSLASGFGGLSRTSNATTGASIGANVANSISGVIYYTAPSSVSATDTIMVRWAQTGSAEIGGSDYFGIDNVTLTSSAAAVPEPSTYAALLGVGALGVVLWRRRRAAAV